MSYVSSIYHIVINTYRRRMTITESHKRDLYVYLYGVIKRMNCRLIRMNGIANHIHILVDLHPSVALSDFVKRLKQGSSRWLKHHPAFPYFEGWGREYFAFSVSQTLTETIKRYIMRQEIHHGIHAYEEEVKEEVERRGGEWDDRWLT